ncbi:coiled-coil domain-containing protein 65 [Ceratitis capitata]|uniref:coiled-coil domain-containing protein 65 n=1 Tax=Ceratitis capitata TaxID=7213 RepID=UPI000329CE7F|nr:coiled-coil domain-containing protein 65 [Ceratitis capitata]
MGKKGKANKLAKMSEEERARYMQMRADIEEEARRRKVQLISLFMKNKLKREEAFCRLNMAKINQEWRSILRQVKVQELRKEMEELQKFFQERLDRKYRIIKRLLNDIDIAEDMYSTLHQSHMEIVNKMIGLQQQRMQFFKDTYEKNKTTVLEEYAQDYADFQQKRQNALEELECVKCQLEDESDKRANEREERHLQQLDDMKSEMQLYIENITKSGESKLERLWQEYQDVLAGYMRRTEGFYAEYMDLKERDEESSKVIRDHYHHIERAGDQLAHLKLVYTDTLENNDVKIVYFVKLRDDLQLRMSESKANFENELKADEERFKLMSVESYNILKHLKSIAAAGETLLQIALVCRKHETEREQLLPLGLPPLSKQMFAEETKAQENEEKKLAEALKDSEQPREQLEEYAFVNWMLMENFWRRVNNARVDVVCMKRQKKTLEEENAQLKAQLQDHLINLNLSNGSNLHINDYLAKRPSSMRVDRVPQEHLKQTKCRSAAEGRRTSVTPSGSNSKGFRRPITACIEANFTSTVRTARLLRGKPKLAKIEAFVRP